MASTDYFLELDGVGNSSPSISPSPGGSAYHTPRASLSRRQSARREVSSSTIRSQSPTDTSSPPPMPQYLPEMHNMKKDDSTLEDDVGPLDPRRFTPTLHASLVSEILNLRRELDNKHRFIEDLETNLDIARNEKDEISEQLSLVEKDRRTMKKQLQHLENGTLTALEELAKDRDGARKQYADVKIKLDEVQDKLRKREEESVRTHAAWEKNQSDWEAERRANERKMHVAETRLKQALAELEAVHLAQAHLQEQHISEEEDQTRDSGLGDESDAASQASPTRHTRHARNISNSSRMSYPRHRFSVVSLTGADGGKTGGLSLADELQLDEEEEDLVSEADSEIHGPDMPSKQGIVSRVSQFFDEKAKRGGLPEPRRVLQAPIDLDRFKGLGRLTESVRPKFTYVDAGVQYEVLETSISEIQTEAAIERSYCDIGIQYDREARNDLESPIPLEQRKDSKTEDAPQVISTPLDFNASDQEVSSASSFGMPRSCAMVSTSSQTDIIPPNFTAASAAIAPAAPVVTHQALPIYETRTTSTQTEFEEQKSMIVSVKHRPAPMTIPSINIVPPLSAPSSPKEPKLPPGTKNADTQTGADLYSTVSVSVQTEEIMIDARLAKLPPHLQPSAISSNPPTPDLKSRISFKNDSSLNNTFTGISPSMSASIDEDHALPSAQIYASTPLKKADLRTASSNTGSTSDRVEGLRRLLRSSVLGSTADVEADTSDREDIKSDREDNEQKVPTFSTPNMSSRSLKHLRTLGGSRPSPVPEEKDESDQFSAPLPMVDSAMASTQSFASGRSSLDAGGARDKDKNKSQHTKANSSKLRRSAIVQSSTNAHRSRTPSVASVGSSSYFSSKSVGPPFPVPDRGSSRKNISSRSEGSSSPTPRSSGGIFGSRRRVAVPVSRKDSLRKVRSANVIQRSNSRGKSRSRSRSPIKEHRRYSPTFPSMPNDRVGPLSKRHISQKSTDKLLAQNLTSVMNKPELSRASQGTVVDAIAATMVGEWMWKYVRRRTSFGVPEAPIEPIGRPGTDGSVNVTGNGVRHKRWVWLSPYERAIMWSSKQPASNTALMGKSGRKLIIQSVLDVRDDTPLPKNHGITDPFNRSILILTPARALKFTATSKERHYTWLTALSFLAHSPLLTTGISLPAAIEEIPKQEAVPSRGSGLKRGGIKDSVRIAKGRARPVRGENPDSQSADNIDSELLPDFGAGSGIPPIPLLPGPEIAAEPPSVPRFAHGRKRSSTGPRLPSSNLRSLGYRDVTSPSFAGSSPISPSIASTRNSEASSATRATFLETVGTIRMEAFIEDHANNLACYSPASTSTPAGRRYTSAAQSPRLNDNRRSGFALGDDYEMGGRFDPFKDFAR